MPPCPGMAIWGRIPVSALPAYVLGQLLGAGVAAASLVAVWWRTLAEVGPEVMSTAPVLGSQDPSLGLDQVSRAARPGGVRTSAVQGLATFLMVLVACSLDHQGHSPAGLLMGLTVATVTITMGQNAGASMNPAADVMPRCRHNMTSLISSNACVLQTRGRGVQTVMVTLPHWRQLLDDSIPGPVFGLRHRRLCLLFPHRAAGSDKQKK